MNNDYAKYLHWKVPAKNNEKIEYKKFTLVKPVVEKPLEFINIPKKSSFLNIMEENINTIASISSSLSDNCKNLKKIIKSKYKNYSNLSHFLNEICSSYIKTEFKNSLLVSDICKTKEFKHYFKDIVKSIDTFGNYYNNILEEFRIKNKIKYERKPFPNLEKRGNIYELPFWYLDKQEKIRKPLFVKKLDNKLSFRTWKNDVLMDLKNFDIKNVRPKALTFTIFFRLFLCDLFIHGIGAGNYEKIADHLIKRYYQVEPPSFFVVSETRNLTHIINSKDKRPDLELRKQRETLNKMKNAPHKFISNSHRLIKRKNKLIQKIKKAEGSQKSDIGLEIKEIDEKLLSQLKPVIEDKKNKIKELKKAKRERKKLKKRNFPYFLFSYK